MTLQTTIMASIAGQFITTRGLGNAQFPVERAPSIVLENGTGPNQNDLIFSDRRTLVASANEDLDLSGQLVDPHGTVLNFATVRAMLFRVSGQNQGNIVISPANTNGFLGPFNDPSDQIILPANASVLVAAPVAGWAVTANTADLLNIENTDASNSGIYDVVIVGTSA